MLMLRQVGQTGRRIRPALAQRALRRGSAGVQRPVRLRPRRVDARGQAAARRAEQLPTRFDVVNFSGVMYHMVDPLAGLAIARSFVREGGLLMLESAGHGRTNTSARSTTAANCIRVTTSCLDRHAGLLAAHVAPGDRRLRLPRRRHLPVGGDHQATAGVVAEPGDKWMTEHWVWQDFVPFGLKYDELRSTAPPTPYQLRPSTKPVPRSGLQSLDLNATMTKSGGADQHGPGAAAAQGPVVTGQPRARCRRNWAVL